MVVPVTGPLLDTQKGLYGGIWCVSYNSRSRYHQKRPYNMVLPYSAVLSVSDSNAKDRADSRKGTPEAHQLDVRGGDTARAANAANIAITKMRDNISASAGLGIDLAQIGESIAMIQERCQRLADAARALRRGHFGTFTQLLFGQYGAHHQTGHEFNTEKGFAGNWLEWHFGWSPLFSDIWDAMETISDPIHFQRVRGQGHDEWFFKSNNHSGDGFYDSEDTRRTVTVKVGANVQITNPNLHLLQSLGLTNPLSVAWDAIPYSFVVDWVANVGGFLNSMGMFAGLALSDAFTTTVYRCQTRTTFANPFWNKAVVNTIASGIDVKRAIGLPSYKLQIKPLQLPSITHALTSWALLAQRL